MTQNQITKSGGEAVYLALRQAILRLELRPGADLDEAMICARFDVSRTPVREALIRLTAEGLVSSGRGRGARVAAMDLLNLRDFFEGLDILQRALTRLAAMRRRPQDLVCIHEHLLACEAAAAQRDVDRITETNYAFHAAIGDAAQSSYLQYSHHRALVEGMRIGHVSFVEHDGVSATLQSHLAATLDDHRALYAAIEAQDKDAAERIAGEHVALFRDRIVVTMLSLDPTRSVSTNDALKPWAADG
ncbi:MAG TPA: GntR family transcriptional regulator [Paenirhodobacter sp.]